jgi:hypothetical protein
MPGRNSSGGVPVCATSTVAVDVGLAGHGALQPEAAVAQLVALGHRLVRVAEVERGVGQALVDQGAQAQRHHGQHHEGQPAAAGAGTGRTGCDAAFLDHDVVVVEGPGGQLHRRSSLGTCRDSLRPRRTTLTA